MQIQSGAPRISQRFADAGQGAGHKNLICHFRALPAACWPHEHSLFPAGRKNGTAFLKVLRIAAGKNCQRPLLGAALSSGHRSVEHAESPLFSLSVKALCQFGTGSGHVNKERSGGSARQYPFRIKIHLFNVSRRAQHCDCRISAAQDFPHRRAQQGPCRR